MPSMGLEVCHADRVMLESWRGRAPCPLVGPSGRGLCCRWPTGLGRRHDPVVEVSRPTVIKRRDRFAAHGIEGLADEARSGRPKTVDDAAIIAATLDPPPESLAMTHWSSLLLGAHLGVGDATAARAWRKYRVQPWRRGTFKFSMDPALEAKVRDVVGLYVNPPTKAIVLCVDEKSQI